MEDEVVLLQPLAGIRLHESRGGVFELLFDHARGQLFEVRVGRPAAGELDELVPVAGERQLEDQADDAVIVVLDLTFEALAAVEDQRVESFFDGRTLVANVSRSLVLEAGFGGAGSEDLAELVKTDLFADVELDQDQNRPTQGCRSRQLGRRRGVVGDQAADHRGCEFAIHKRWLPEPRKARKMRRRLVPLSQKAVEWAIGGE